MKFTKIVIGIIFIISLESCVLLDPNYYTWHNSDGEVGKSRMPWSGIDKKPITQSKTYFIGYPMSNIKYRTKYRWNISLLNKTNSGKFADDIGKYLAKKSVMQKWGYDESRKGAVYGATPPYELTLVSVTPSIIVMRLYTELDLKKSQFDFKFPKNTGAFSSKYFYRSVLFGTKLRYQEGLIFFSPDLDILPQPLNLTKDSSKTIYWNTLFNSGGIEFTEKDGVVYTKRIKNKEGKDYKKSESYDPDYYLSLKEHENKQSQQHGK